jgi:hypothetical protein
MYTGISKQNVYRLVNMVTKVISTRIDEVLIERFDKKAAAANITRNELIAKLISDFLGSDGIVDSTVDKGIQVAVDKAVDKGIQDAIAPLLARLETLESEATVSAKKPLTLSQNQKVIAIQKLQATA